VAEVPGLNHRTIGSRPPVLLARCGQQDQLVGIDEDADEVRARVRTADGQTAIAARYVIAADGGASPVRAMLGIATSGTPATHYYRNLYFRADLTEVVPGHGIRPSLPARNASR
jgi:2-polyprenyl-6-methoxyphenol hydroxylase-like FAD-dependent oxidoreductase